ncbi:MAG: type II secretion system F family protein [Nitrospirales bacterium]
MAVFIYSGRNDGGQALNGEVVADSLKGAISVLRTRHVLVTKIAQKSVKFERWNWSRRDVRTAGIKAQDLLSFTQQFATMLKAGIPLLECLTILAQHSESQTLRQILEDIRQDIEGGAGLADSLRKHPRVFSDFYVNMIDVGEATGMMDALLKRLGLYLERQATLKGRVLSALAYPAALLGVACLVLIFMLMWVVPLFDQMFSEFGDTLPWMTQVVLNLSNWIQGNVLFLITVILGIAIGVQQFYHSSQGRMWIDSFLLRAPLLGRLFQTASVVQFSRTLGILLGSGVPILDGLQIAGKVSGNRLVEQTIEAVRHRIREGETITEPLAQSAIFPQMVTHMIRVGESTGSLDTMLDQIADLYEQEMDRTISMLTALLEPAVILLIGVGIGMMVIAMYLPLFSMGALI